MTKEQILNNYETIKNTIPAEKDLIFGDATLLADLVNEKGLIETLHIAYALGYNVASN